jgi:hypothetical protein
MLYVGPLAGFLRIGYRALKRVNSDFRAVIVT